MHIHGKQYYKPPPFEVLDRSDVDDIPQHAQDIFYSILDALDSGDFQVEVLRTICEQYDQYPCFVAIHADIVYQCLGLEDAISVLQEGIDRLPDALILKISLARIYWELDEIETVETLMIGWMDVFLLKVDKPLYITEFYQLTKLYIDYFDYDYETSSMLEVYSWTLDDRYYDIAYDLSIDIIKKTIKSDEMEEDLSEADEDYLQEEMKIASNLSLDYFDKLKLNKKPYYPIFEEILKHEDYMFVTPEQIATLDQLPTDKEVSHDVKWVIKETLINAYRNETYEFDPILIAVLVAGSKKLVDCLPTMLEIYKVSYDTGEHIYDDDEMQIVGNSIGYMIDDHWPIIREWLMNSDIDWYHKSTFMQVIATKMKLGECQIEISEIEKLGNFYYPDHIDEFNWLCYSFAEVNFRELKDFFKQDKFVKIYNDQIIDLDFFDRNTFSNDLTFDFTLKEIFANLATMYSLREENMRKFMEADEEEKDFSEFRNIQIKNDQLLEIVNLNAVEALKFRDQEIEENLAYQEPIVNLGTKMGRNDLCPCGSGNKYKKCCLNLN